MDTNKKETINYIKDLLNQNKISKIIIEYKDKEYFSLDNLCDTCKLKKQICFSCYEQIKLDNLYEDNLYRKDNSYLTTIKNYLSSYFYETETEPKTKTYTYTYTYPDLESETYTEPESKTETYTYTDAELKKLNKLFETKRNPSYMTKKVTTDLAEMIGIDENIHDKYKKMVNDMVNENLFFHKKPKNDVIISQYKLSDSDVLNNDLVEYKKIIKLHMDEKNEISNKKENGFGVNDIFNNAKCSDGNTLTIDDLVRSREELEMKLEE